MKCRAIASLLSASAFLLGCGGLPRTTALLPTTQPTSDPAPKEIPYVAGNWEFTATPSSPGPRPFLIAGGITQTDATVRGAFHVDGANCFDRLMSRSLAGTVSVLADESSVTVTGSDGQVITLTGGLYAPTTFYGTQVYPIFNGKYKIDGGCAAGDQGTFTGKYIDNIARESDPTTLSGTFVSGSTQQTFHATGNIVQDSTPSATGNFGISGDAKFDVPCLSAGNIRAASYPNGSFILGSSVAIEIDTSSGVLTFLGRVNPDKREISGNYSVSGSSCNDSGTAVLGLSSPGIGYWDY